MKNKASRSKLFDSKLLWVIVSLLTSLLIWVYLTGTNEEPITRKFDDVQVELVGEDVLMDSKGFVVTELDTSEVSVQISGTRSNIAHLSDKDIKAVVDVSRISSANRFTVTYELRYPDDVDASAVSVLSSSPRTVSFFVSKVSSRQFQVKGAFVGSPAEGYIAEELEFEPEYITVSGPDSALSQIDHVWVTIGGEEVNKTKSADLPFVLRDEDGRELELKNLEYDLDTVRVTLPISAKKEVPLTVNIVEGAGAVEGTYTVTIDPSSIIISGDSAIVNGINKIELGTIDLTDFTATFEDSFPITFDNGVSNVTGVTEAKVKVEIIGLESKQLTVSNLSFVNCPEGYTAEILTRSIEVRIRASAEALKDIKSNNLRAVADLADIATVGDISVPVKIHVDGSFAESAGAVGDYTITVNIKS